MKKTILLCTLLFGIFLIAGCTQQPDSNQETQPIFSEQKTIEDEKQDNPAMIQDSTQPTEETSNSQKYKSVNLGISFQYPKGWYVKEEKMNGIGYRIYIQNTKEEVNKGNMPSDFQSVWISTWEQEINEETENDVKNGTPNGREFGGSLSAGTIDGNVFVINTYEYNTIGGPTLQAFWSDKNGKRYYATNSTEVGQENQKNMVKNLKLILSTVEFTN